MPRGPRTTTRSPRASGNARREPADEAGPAVLNQVVAGSRSTLVLEPHELAHVLVVLSLTEIGTEVEPQFVDDLDAQVLEPERPARRRRRRCRCARRPRRAGATRGVAGRACPPCSPGRLHLNPVPGPSSSSTFGAAGLGTGAPSEVSSFSIASIGSRSPRSLAVIQPFVRTSTAFSFCPVLDEALAEVLEDARERRG